MNVSRVEIEDLLNVFLSSKSKITESIYRSDLRVFSKHLNSVDVVDSLVYFFNLPVSQAELTVLHYRGKLIESNRKLTGINRRISTLRSLVKSAKKEGIIDWILDIKNYESRAENPRKVLSWPEMKLLLGKLKKYARTPKEIRDYAIIRLMWDLSLSSENIIQLELSHYQNATLCISVNKKQERRTIRLKDASDKALCRWIKERGGAAGPLFNNLDHAGKGVGLTVTSIYRIVVQAGNKGGVGLIPSMLRKI